MVLYPKHSQLQLEHLVKVAIELVKLKRENVNSRAC